MGCAVPRRCCPAPSDPGRYECESGRMDDGARRRGHGTNWNATEMVPAGRQRPDGWRLIPSRGSRSAAWCGKRIVSPTACGGMVRRRERFRRDGRARGPENGSLPRHGRRCRPENGSLPRHGRSGGDSRLAPSHRSGATERRWGVAAATATRNRVAGRVSPPGPHTTVHAGPHTAVR